MKLWTTLLLPLFIGAMLVWVLAASAENATCNVPSATYPTIQSAANDETCTDIQIAAGTYSENVELYVLGSSTVRHVAMTGADPETTIIDGSGAGTTLFIFAENLDSTFTVSNLTFVNGSAASGGGIFNQNANLTLDDVIVRDNVATGNGGGIFNAFGSRLTVRNARIENNSASRGGGIYNQGNTALDDGMTIEDTLILSNTATFANSSASSSDAGGGIFNNGTLTVSGSLLYKNQATAGSGGGIAATGNGNQTAVISTTLSVNSAAAYGGGLYHNGAFNGFLDLQDASIEFNSSTLDGGGLFNRGNSSTVTVQRSSFVGNSAERDGGGIDTDGGLVTIVNTTISHNRVPTTTGRGGGLSQNIRFGAGVAMTFTTVAFNDAHSGSDLHITSDLPPSRIAITGDLRLTNSVVAAKNADKGCEGEPFIKADGSASNDPDCLTNGSDNLLTNADMVENEPTSLDNGTQANLPVDGSPIVNSVENLTGTEEDQGGYGREPTTNRGSTGNNLRFDPDLIITEIMHSPVGTPKYIELLYASGAAANSICFVTPSSDAFISAPIYYCVRTKLPLEQFSIICGTANVDASCDMMSSFVESLSFEKQKVSVGFGRYARRDKVSWERHSIAVAAYRRSMCVLFPSLPNDSLDRNWGISVSPEGGSPGAANSDCAIVIINSAHPRPHRSASHKPNITTPRTVSTTVYLGTNVRFDHLLNPQQINEGDGVQILDPNWVEETAQQVAVSVTGDGCLSGRIDWNGDDDFTDANENVIGPINITAAASPHAYTVTPPAGSISGQGAEPRFDMRFRYAETCAEIAEPFGTADSGEVEDYTLIVGEGTPVPTAVRLMRASADSYRLWGVLIVVAFVVITACIQRQLLPLRK